MELNGERDRLYPAVMTFMDEDGAEWVAGAQLTTLAKKGSDEKLEPFGLVDRAFKLKTFNIIKEAE